MNKSKQNAMTDIPIEIMEQETIKEKKVTPFGLSRIFLLFVMTIYSVVVGSHFFNWSPWERILIDSGAYHYLCDDPSVICAKQREKIAAILPLTSLFMFSFTFVAGMCLDIIGPKICCIMGNLLLIAGWIVLTIPSTIVDTYSIGFALVGAGTDPAFFGILSLSNLFPSYSSTVIAIFGGARSLSNLWPFILSFMISDKFKFRHMAVIFAVVYSLCLITVTFLVPRKNYPKIVKQNEDTIVGSGEDAKQETCLTSVNETKHNLIKKRSIPAEMEIKSNLQINDNTSCDKEMIEPSASNIDRNAFSTRLIINEFKLLGNYLTSNLYYPIVLITILNVIRNNYYLTSATLQLDESEWFLSLLNVLAFIPGPVCGYLVDNYGPISVITGLNTCNLCVFIVLLLSEFNKSVLHAVFNFSSAIFAFPCIGFLLSQMYCYVLFMFNSDDMGKLAGFASFIAGICGLVVSPMFNFSIHIGKFFPMNLVNLGLSFVSYGLIMFIVYNVRMKKNSQKHATELSKPEV